MKLGKVLAVLASARLDMNNEATLQLAIAKALSDAGIRFQREFVLSPRDRIDFLCEGGIGIEVKIKGSAADIARQMKRYEESEEINMLVLATRRSFDLDGIDFIKPFATVWLSRAWL